MIKAKYLTKITEVNKLFIEDVISEGDKNDVLTELKNHVNDMAAEIKKEDVANEMQYLYKILLSFS